jgi:hypothetical protein
MTQNNKNRTSEIFGYLQPARFDALALAGATVATLVSLRDDSVPGVMIAEAAEKMWVQLTNKAPLRTSERAIIDKVILDLKTGTATQGQSYEEMAYAKGTQVAYTQKSITLTPKSAEAVVIPNHPVPPPSRVRPREAQEWIDAWAQNYDIVKGQVVLNKQFQEMQKVWEGPYSRIDLTGIEPVRVLVERILRTSPSWAEVQKDKKSVVGLAFFDMWTTACATCDYLLYLALHDVVIRTCFKHVHLKKGANGIDKYTASKAHDPVTGQAVRAYPETTISPVKQAGLTTAERTAAKEFFVQTEHYPYFVTGPIETPMNFYASPGASDQIAIKAYARATKLYSQKRGVGRIAASFNFAPRMSRVWREVNTLCALMLTMPNEHMDVRLTSAAFPMVLSFIKSKSICVHARILLEDSQQTLVTSLSVSDQAYAIFERRQKAVCIMVHRRVNVPVFDTKKVKLAADVMRVSHEAFLRTLPQGRYAVSTTVCDERVFVERNVYRFRASMDLSAVVTTEKLQIPEETPYFELVDAKEFFSRAVRDMRKMIGWWYAPAVTYSHLASVYVPKPGTLQWTAETGFQMDPTFDYGPHVEHEEDDIPSPEDYEDGDDPEDGDDDTDDNDSIEQDDYESVEADEPEEVELVRPAAKSLQERKGPVEVKTPAVQPAVEVKVEKDSSGAISLKRAGKVETRAPKRVAVTKAKVVAAPEPVSADDPDDDDDFDQVDWTND